MTNDPYKKYLIVCPENDKLKIASEHCLKCHSNSVFQPTKDGVAILCKPTSSNKDVVVYSLNSETMLDW